MRFHRFKSPASVGSPFGLLASLLGLSHPAALVWVLLLTGCAGIAPPESGRSEGPGYAHHVPPGVLFDMRQGRELPPDLLAPILARTRIVFLGEHHTEPRSHELQRELLETLVRSGRPVTVALEMFPPEADPVLEDWRQGRLDEHTFLTRSKWYSHWGFPWGYYRDLFNAIRDHRIGVHGVNASKETRKAVREDALDALTLEQREVAGGPEAPLPPHQRYVFDAITNSEHGENLSLESEAFRRYYRVQRLWDRAMGLRTARLAMAQPGDGVTVLLVGSGHLAHGLGANLWARRESGLSTLTVWDAVVQEASPDGTVRVPLGVGDWVRVYLEDSARKPLPWLRGLRFDAKAEGLVLAGVYSGHGSSIKGLKKGDRIIAFNGKPVQDEVTLRLAYEQLGESQALLEVERDGGKLVVDITPRPSPHER